MDYPCVLVGKPYHVGSVVGQFKLGRLQFAERRFSLVGSSDMLIKVDFVKMGRAGWQTPPQQKP